MQPRLERMKVLIDEIHECADDENLSLEEFSYVAADNIHELKELFDRYFEEQVKSGDKDATATEESK